MKLFKKIDDFLLHYYPSIWITRVHIFLPLGLGIALFLFLITVSIGWDVKDEMPRNDIAVVLMIIPVLIYLIYWFVFQSRYNVAKSGGKMTIRLEYLNYFLYMLVFLTSFLIISAIPLGNYQRIRNAVDEDQLKSDVEKLNAGNTLMNQTADVTFNLDGTISFYPSSFTWYSYPLFEPDVNYSEPYYPLSQVVVSRNQAEQLISDYIKAYNNYSFGGIHKSASQILSQIESNEYYYGLDEYGYDPTWEVQQKVSSLISYSINGWYAEYSEEWFWKVFLGLMAFASLLVWIFKQMILRYFVYGFISICLTPLFVAIIGVIIFELLGFRNEEFIGSGVVLAFYILFAIISIRSFKSETLKPIGYFITMYLQFFVPLLPLFLWMFFIYEDSYYYDSLIENTMNAIYILSWIFGLISILVFKPLYSKFRSLPSSN
jgi:hypothetical protein